jgi:polysaccharide export outer membrane protein
MNLKKILFLFSIAALISSCTRYKNITYLNYVDPSTADSLFRVKQKDYKLQPADILYIKVNSLDLSINEMFNKGITSQNTSYSYLGGFYILGYTIEPDGNIILPVLGKIPVAGLTVSQAHEVIQKQADKYIANAQIEMRLVSFKISVLGEVKKPGQFNIYNDRANIFEALANAGDISYYGNRKNILLMRNDGSETHTYRINLSDKSILSSPLFYVQPNDVIIVEPLKSTGLRLSASDLSILISTITATLTTIVLINNLSK